MTPEFPPNNPRAELEARLTAFILGELPAHDAAALRQTIDDDTELAALCERLSAAHKLVREAVASPAEPAKESAAPLRLSEARRQKLLAQFKTVAPKEFAPQRKPVISRRLLEIAAVIALVGLITGMLLSMFSVSKHEMLSSRLAVASAHEPGAASGARQVDVMPSGSETSQQIVRELDSQATKQQTAEKIAPPIAVTNGLAFDARGTRHALALPRGGNPDKGKLSEEITLPPSSTPPAKTTIVLPPADVTEPATYARATHEPQTPQTLTVVPSEGESIRKDLAEDMTLPPLAKPATPPAKTTIVLPPVDDSGNGEVALTWKTHDGSTQPPVVLGNVPAAGAQSSSGGTGGASGSPFGFFSRFSSVNGNAVGDALSSAQNKGANLQGTSETKTFALKNADAKETANLISNLFPGSIGVNSDPNTGSVTITADKEQMAAVNSVVSSLDDNSRRKQHVRV